METHSGGAAGYGDQRRDDAYHRRYYFMPPDQGDIRTSHIPVILLTAKSAKDSQLVGLEAGADDYISKPFNMEMLLLKVRHLIEMKKKMQRPLCSPLPWASP